MDKFFDILKENNLIDDDEYNNFSDINNIMEQNRNKLINQLIEGNKLKHSVYKKEREDEQILIKEIEEIISSNEFKRAQNNMKLQDSINNILEKIENEKIEICTSSNFLKQMIEKLKDIIDSQLELEEEEMKLIEKSIGKTMFKEYREFFNTDEFFDIMNICRNLE